MILIADGGSTKCDWVLLDSSGNILLKTRTKGLNPAIISEEELKNRICDNKDLQKIFETVTAVDFYGAGCGTPSPKKILHGILSQFFKNATISVEEDMVAAVYAATHQEGIICIFGTGSNSCYFDGENIHFGVESLGYILMDEASGNYFGKRLIRDYYYKKMPPAIAKDFENQFDVNADTIKLNLYKNPNPNAYLASFAEFIFQNEQIKPESYFQQLLEEGIERFIQDHILSFEKAQDVPIHFIGSIAFYSEEIIKKCFAKHQLTLGNIIQRPIDGLIRFYKNHKLASL